MGIFTRWRRRADPYAAVTEEERIARYVYLLNTLPSSVVERAHATAFADLPVQQRREMFAQLRPFMADTEKDAADDDPTVLARLVRRAEEHRLRRANGVDTSEQATLTAVHDRDPRDAVDSRGLLLQAATVGFLAHHMLASSTVMYYFEHGGGSVGIASEPAWVGQTFDPVGTGWESSGAGGFDGGGASDGGGFGGFDGGGFGGFDGGGGF
ncbi:hypothetical protein QL996_12425 [Planococcus sp. APC 4015]|nr:hypothetical protein [Planococcus sp. APC 4015]